MFLNLLFIFSILSYTCAAFWAISLSLLFQILALHRGLHFSCSLSWDYSFVPQCLKCTNISASHFLGLFLSLIVLCTSSKSFMSIYTRERCSEGMSQDGDRPQNQVQWRVWGFVCLFVLVWKNLYFIPTVELINTFTG